MAAQRSDKTDRVEEDRYTIGEISKIYHIGPDSLRYYEEKGILEPKRGENGYRYYGSHSIWRMNVITNLRSLGFPVERIREYFQNRTADTTAGLLQEELEAISQKLRELVSMQQTVRGQLSIIKKAQSLELGKIHIAEYGPRRVFTIQKPHSTDEDMDLLMRKLLEQSGKMPYMIGNNHMASVLAEDGEPYTYSGAILFDEQGDKEIAGGMYLSVYYGGATDSRRYAQQLAEYAREHNIPLAPPFFDLVWIDIHTASNPEEHISEVQVRTLL